MSKMKTFLRHTPMEYIMRGGFFLLVSIAVAMLCTALALLSAKQPSFALLFLLSCVLMAFGARTWREWHDEMRVKQPWWFSNSTDSNG